MIFCSMPKPVHKVLCESVRRDEAQGDGQPAWDCTRQRLSLLDLSCVTMIDSAWRWERR